MATTKKITTLFWASPRMLRRKISKRLSSKRPASFILTSIRRLMPRSASKRCQRRMPCFPMTPSAHATMPCVPALPLPGPRRSPVHPPAHMAGVLAAFRLVDFPLTPALASLDGLPLPITPRKALTWWSRSTLLRLRLKRGLKGPLPIAGTRAARIAMAPARSRPTMLKRAPRVAEPVRSTWIWHPFLVWAYSRWSAPNARVRVELSPIPVRSAGVRAAPR